MCSIALSFGLEVEWECFSDVVSRRITRTWLLLNVSMMKSHCQMPARPGSRQGHANGSVLLARICPGITWVRLVGDDWGSAKDQSPRKVGGTVRGRLA